MCVFKFNWVVFLFLCSIQVFLKLAWIKCSRANGDGFVPPQRRAEVDTALVPPWQFLLPLVHGLRGAEGKGMARTSVCSRDEREAAGNCPAGLFLFHPPAGGQSLDTARWEMLESEESVGTCKTEKGAAVLGKFKGICVKAGWDWRWRRAPRLRARRNNASSRRWLNPGWQAQLIIQARAASVQQC